MITKILSFGDVMKLSSLSFLTSPFNFRKRILVVGGLLSGQAPSLYVLLAESFKIQVANFHFHLFCEITFYLY